MMKKLTYLVVLLLAVAIIAACGATPTATPVPPSPTAVPTATRVPSSPTVVPTATSVLRSPTASASFPLTITDPAGRTVTLKALPQRVISLSPANTEMLFAVGAGDQVVGVTQFCNYPPEATRREQIGGYSAKTINIEKIVSLKPDLVVAESGIHNDVIKALEPLGITVVALKARTFDDAYTNMELLGRLTGHPDKAAQTIATMKARVKAVTDKVATIPKDKRPTVFWEIWDEPLMTVGPGAFAGQIVEMAGGVNIFADVTTDYPQVSAEEVIKRNPAVIMGPDSHADKLTVEQIAGRPGWANLAAVKNKRIYLINGDQSSRVGPRLADALEATARALYPDLFK